jgi:uncharacterized membrane protein
MREKTIHQLFDISVSLKGIHALIEIASGLALALVSTGTIVRQIDGLTRSELLEDPHDFLALHALKFAEGFSDQTHHFYAFYLLCHGLVKVALVIGLLRQKLWAYPASFIIFGTFIGYQLYRYSYTHEFSLILLSLLDLFVIALAIHEYRLLRDHLATH